MGMEDSIKLLESCVNKTDYIIVGCSSGPDSMCLLKLLYNYNYNIVCAHINHNIREESKEEYDFLKNYCETYNIPFEGLELEKGINDESYYRKKRYDFYKKTAKKYNTPYIATAHHGDDLIETILMRISRGSNLKGYLGFSSIYKEKEFIFLKPLIYYTKDEIVEYNLENQIPFFNDMTNESDDYTRNRYRHHILPFLKSENKNIHKKFLQFSQEIKNANDFIKSTVEKELKNNYNNNVLNLKLFMKLDDYIKAKELEEILSKIYGDFIDHIKNKHIKSIINNLKNGNNFSLDLPCGFIVKREYDRLIFAENVKSNRYKFELTDYNELENGYIIERVISSSDTSNNVIRLNNRDITYPLYIRTRENGDRIRVKNLNGTKKLKEIFINEKVPLSLRNTYPIITDANNVILWIPGIKKSNLDSDINEKCDIILEYKRKGELNEK